MIKLPVHISTNPDTAIICIRDSDNICIANHLSEAHAHEIARALNSQASHPAVIALANVCAEIETGAYAGPMYLESLKVISQFSTE